jgi:Reprolysin (M12B) family zinc metalloprotease/Domain of unknown function DUF11
MRNRTLVTSAALLLCCFLSFVARSESLRILYAEPFQPQTSSAPGARKPGPANLRIHAFGRTFELELEDNNRLLRATSAQGRERIGSIQLLKGSIKDAAGSWVRLTLSGGRYSGAFWDGSELYAVVGREDLADALLTPMPPAATALYRLSDTQGGLLQGTCAVGSGRAAQPAAHPLAKFKAMLQELRAADSALVAASREIEVSMVADFELTSRLGSRTAGKLLEQANIVDGIFSSQLGVSTIPTDFISFATDSDGLSSSDPSTLLEQFSEYRNSTPAVRSRGLAHLMTGRQLAGSTIGIAYLGSLCEPQFGSSLSESSNFVDSALIMAHELGHNFGAPHDAQASSACATTPLGFIMAPELGNSTQFSACSVQQMQPHVAAASCVVTSRNRDVAVSVPADTLEVVVNEPFEVPIDLQSIGDTDAANLIITISLPFGVAVSSASLPGGGCEIGLSDIRCELRTLAAGATARLSVLASYPSASVFAFHVGALSSNDVNSSNDEAIFRGQALGQRALQVRTVSVPGSVTRGDPFDVELEVAAVGNQMLSNVLTEVALFRSRAIAATIDGGTCDTTANGEITLHCTIGSLAPGTPRRLRAQLVSDAVGPAFGQVSAQEPGGVGTAIARFTIPTLAAHDVELWTDQEDRLSAVGVDTLWQIEVRSSGAYAINDVHVRLGVPSGPNASLQGPLAALCTRTSAFLLECDLGTLAAGAVVAGQLRYRSDVPTNRSFQLQVVPVLQDDDPTNDSMVLDLSVRVASEISLTAPTTQSVVEMQPAALQATIGALGALNSEEINVSIVLPTGFSIRSARLAQNACTLQSGATNAATCTRPSLQPDATVPLLIEYLAPAAGVYTGSITATARQDTDTSNNARSIRFQVGPAVSGSVSAPPSAVLPRGEPIDVVFTVRTNQYALTDARLDFGWFGELEHLTAIAPGAVCSPFGSVHRCIFGTIAANSTIPVTVRLRSDGDSDNTVSINAALSSPAETSPKDNGTFVIYNFVTRGDMTVSAQQGSVTAIAGQRFDLFFDMISVVTAVDAFVEIGFDPARIQSPAALSGSRCTWTTQPVRCELGTQVAAGTYRNNFSFIPAGTGPLQITLRVGARNDFNAANDQAVVDVNVNDRPSQPAPPPPAPTTPPTSSSGGSGGGGSMSRLLMAPLMLIWTLMWHHQRSRRRAPRQQSPPT